MVFHHVPEVSLLDEVLALHVLVGLEHDVDVLLLERNAHRRQQVVLELLLGDAPRVAEHVEQDVDVLELCLREHFRDLPQDVLLRELRYRERVRVRERVLLVVLARQLHLHATRLLALLVFHCVVVTHLVILHQLAQRNAHTPNIVSLPFSHIDRFIDEVDLEHLCLHVLHELFIDLDLECLLDVKERVIASEYRGLVVERVELQVEERLHFLGMVGVIRHLQVEALEHLYGDYFTSLFGDISVLEVRDDGRGVSLDAQCLLLLEPLERLVDWFPHAQAVEDLPERERAAHLAAVMHDLLRLEGAVLLQQLGQHELGSA